MRPRKNGAGREFCPTETAESKVFAVSDLVLILALNPSPNKRLPACGNSSEARDDRVPFELILLRAALRRSLDKSAEALANRRIAFYVIAPRSFICS